jgi:hypothetical protein
MVAVRIATEFTLEFCYNIQMLGFEGDGPIKLLGGNNTVVLNTTIPSSQLKKKHQACAYHWIREAIAGSVIDFRHIPSHLNLADIGTKPLGRVVFHRLIDPVLYGDGTPTVFTQPLVSQEIPSNTIETL